MEIATGASVVAYGVVMRGVLHGIEFRRLLWSVIRITAAAALLAGVSYLVWLGLDETLGTSVPAQIVSLGVALAAGAAVYFAAVIVLRVPEADQVLRMLRRAGRQV